jgi:hypothetical protein
VSRILNRTTQYFKATQANTERDVDFPLEAANYMIKNASDYEFGFRQLRGVARVPLIDLATGEITQKSGYCARSGMMIEYMGRLGNVPETPSQEEARAASVVLTEPFAYFIADERTDIAHVLVSALTAILRPSIPKCPAIVIDANEPGTGKDYMAEALATLTTP